jgi:hypothetical protein
MSSVFTSLNNFGYVSYSQVAFVGHSIYSSCRLRCQERQTLIHRVLSTIINTPNYFSAEPLLPSPSKCIVLLLHVITQNNTHSIWLPWTRDRSVAECYTYKTRPQGKNIYAPSGIRNRDPKISSPTRRILIKSDTIFLRKNFIKFRFC